LQIRKKKVPLPLKGIDGGLKTTWDFRRRPDRIIKVFEGGYSGRKTQKVLEKVSLRETRREGLHLVKKEDRGARFLGAKGTGFKKETG